MSDFVDVDGCPVPGGGNRCVEHTLGLQRVGEVGQGERGLAPAEHRQDVAGLVDEAVLVAQAVAVGPPRVDVRVTAPGTGDVDRGPALDGGGGVHVVVV